MLVTVTLLLTLREIDALVDESSPVPTDIDKFCTKVQYRPTINTTCVDCESTPAKAFPIPKLKLVTFPTAGLPTITQYLTHHIPNHHNIASTRYPKIDSNVGPFVALRVVGEVNVHILDLDLEVILEG